MDVGSSTVQTIQSQIAEEGEGRDDQPCTLFIDGSSTRDGVGVGIVLKSLEGSVIEQSVRLGFIAPTMSLNTKLSSWE